MFVAALVPLARLVLGALGLGGIRLGADPIAIVTDTLGLWGLRLLLATLAMSPLRYLTGSSEWLRLRRLLGLYAFGYLTLHFAMYIAVDQGLDFAVLAEDVLTRPWITVGAAALALLVPLALTSTRRAMQRLGRRWQQLHYAIYPATLFGCWHYYWQVKRDVRAPLAYGAVFALLMAVRLWHKRRARRRAFAAAGSAAG